MKNLVVRTLSGLVLGVVMLGCILYSQWSFGALLFVLLVGGMLEFYGLARKHGNEPQTVVGIVAGAVLFGLSFAVTVGGTHSEQLTGIGVAFLLLLLPLMFICELYRRQPNPIAGIGATLGGIFYVAFPLALVCHIPTMWGEREPVLMVYYLFMIWANDVFAYLVGMAVGRNPLFERLSPKKTWEGFFGGLAGAVLVGAIGSWQVGGSMAAWIGLALVAAVTGVLGDLVESMFKRAAGVKDSGNLIPGHGGVLDRFDALLLSAPFVTVYLYYVM